VSASKLARSKIFFEVILQRRKQQSNNLASAERGSDHEHEHEHEHEGEDEGEDEDEDED
jgi:hypothetical protein